MALTVNAVAASDYTVAASPGTLSVARGANGTSTVAITRTNFTGAVTFAAAGLPSGVTVAFNPSAATTGNSVIATFSASSTATLGAATVTLTATSGTLSHTTTVALTVTGSTDGGTASDITYQFTLAPGQTLGASSNRMFAVQRGGSGTAHPTAGDTYSVT